MKSIGILCSLILFACSTKTPKYIQGYVYNEEKKPLESIKVEDPHDSLTYSFTNEKGYFRINMLTKGEYLYMKQSNKIIDSIYYIRTHPERGERYYFVEGRNDTVFIDMKLNRIIKQ
ncbi:carboxypeptidase regulatory-like domain-containing protein [Flavobacterium columnare]|uniref:Carboxypeptidase regulatory-like domain-containing protein n=1 Tax=Flavobacterium columnare (strain ATCC 49512 / CIP 103533 / TG 44/87) TaxID=1041826 RepID=G8X5Z5_FLACA|nr:carboxypeptidase-like regulatory domain-containing protein [Flavobacterium columnare]AEW85598.1 hypothetical protein FCOL_03790 [Flavobacterium columnare ATCC 49512]ANO47476.1 hypothetical protein Pf1_02021 [Flavobacterium columnare]APT21884.1 hypothetical protein BU993_04065 [Flavobacterium columnare]MBF6652132.1 carboxypeptidase regulatory-like domain-containing protein [Flavobacterium columnare]QOG89406.1 carboxypeptidase regulatory-like domain-containing protein [Flavobacterium columnar